MAMYYNPGIVTNGLTFCMDSKNSKANGYRASELDISSWTVGTGSVTGFTINGDGNSRLIDTNPWGYPDIIWDVSGQDAASDADGGWNTSIFDIDKSYTYRFSVWINRNVQGNGNTYLGTGGFNSSDTNVGVLNRSNGASNTNPYFTSSTWSRSNDVWYLVVGHVWAEGSGTGSIHEDSGFWEVDGTKTTTSLSDYVWSSTSVRTRHRSYLYYSTDTGTQQQWYHPRVDKCDGTEPSIQDLLNSINNWMDTTKRTPDVTLQEAVVGADGFEFVASNDNSSISVPLANSFNKQEGTIECWINPTSYATSNGIFVNRDSSVINALDWIWIGAWSSGSLLYLRIGDGTNCCTQDATLSSFSTTHAPTGTWTHLACTWLNGGNSEIYINGVDVGGRTGPLTIPSTSPATEGRIGLGHTSGGTGSWNGKIDQFKIYNRQLTAAEISQNYHATKGRYA